MTTFSKAVLVSVAVLTSVSAQERRNTTEQQPHTGTRTEAESSGRSSQMENNRPYYDSKRRDWHQWNDSEEQSYHRYSEQHHLNNNFSQLNEKQQQEYWNWRHKHGDQH